MTRRKRRMKVEVETDVVRKVYDRSGHFLEVGPWPDSPNVAALMTIGKKNEEYFGTINLSMSTEFARQIGRALIACADELDAAGR